MVDMFNDLWEAMTDEQKKGISWLATGVTNRGEVIAYGDTSLESWMDFIATAANSLARERSTNYEEYQEQVIALCKGIASGLLEGGIQPYLREGNSNEWKRPTTP